MVSTLPLRTPRMVRRWLSTDTTRYFSSKIAPFGALIAVLDANSPSRVFRFAASNNPCKPIIGPSACFRKSANLT